MSNTVIKFIINKSPQYDLKIGYDGKYIEESINTKYFGIPINNHLNCKNHIDLVIPKLSRACYVIKSMSHVTAPPEISDS
jgi:hypothetical protein